MKLIVKSKVFVYLFICLDFENLVCMYFLITVYLNYLWLVSVNDHLKSITVDLWTPKKKRIYYILDIMSINMYANIMRLL